MPALLVPFDVSGPITAPETSLPPLFTTIRLPDCPVAVYTTSSGSIWEQELRINGFLLGVQWIAFGQEGRFTGHCVVDTAVLLFVLQGGLRLTNEKGISKQLGAMQYTLLTSQADCPVEVSISEGPVQTFQLAFSLRMLRQLPGALIQNATQQPGLEISGVEIAPYQLAITNPVEQLLKKLTSADGKPGMADVLRLNEGCLKLLNRFSDERAIYQAQQRWVEKKRLSIRELTAFLADHLDAGSREQVTLVACAKKMQLDTATFRRLFESQYGVTLFKYLYQQRMEKAFYLLAQSGWVPTDVYEVVGYRNFSGFTRAFLNYFGQLPSAVATKGR